MPPTYTKVKSMLWNLVKDGMLELPHRDHPQQAYLWSLKGVRPPRNYYNRAHDEAVGDLFVAYWNACNGEIYWDVRWPDDDKENYRIDEYRVHYDARMHYQNKVFLFELDRSTEPMKDFAEKIDKYIKFSNAYPDERFTVAIVVQGYRYMSALDRLKQIAVLLAGKKRANQFVLGLYDRVIENPLGEVYISPLDFMVARSLDSF